MIPIQLTIEGLYSYQKRQTINFSDLTEAGLFGIFGTVGSGKSSILEAITFALYGETERMNAKEKRAYNMMNLKSDKSFIEFEFYNYNNEKFRITRTFKRNSKRFDDVKPIDTIFYHFKDNNWIPLENSNAEEIVGISYTNFKRTIIIPQGQFKEFLELGATDRTKMMKEIFSLQRYDLQEKTSNLVTKTKSELDQLHGKLSGYESISEENIQQLKTEFTLLSEKELTLKSEYEEFNEHYQRLKSLKADFDSLKTKKIQFDLLEVQKPEKDAIELQINEYESIYKTFYQLLVDRHKTNSEIESNKIRLSEYKEKLATTKVEINEVSSKLQQLKPLFDNLKNERLKESDLALIAQILDFKNEIKELESNSQKGLKYVEELKLSAQNISKNIVTLEDEIHNFSLNKIDSSILIAVDNWFVQEQNIIKDQESVRLKIKSLKENIEKIINEFSIQNSSVDSFEKEYVEDAEKRELEKIELEKSKNEFLLQQKLAEYSNQLHDGVPCPLCGSHEHPNIVETQDVSTKLTQIQLDINKNTDESINLSNKLNAFRNLKQQKDFFEQQLLNENNILATTHEKLVLHQHSFIWKEFSKDNKSDFDQRKDESLQIENKLIAKNKELQEQRVKLDQQRQIVDKANAKLEKYKLEEAQKATQIAQNNTQIKLLSVDNFQNNTSAEVNLALDKLRITNNETEQAYEKFTKLFSDLTPKIASQETSIALITDNIFKLQKELDEIDHKIQDSLKINEIESIDKVKEILKQNININDARKSIEDFRLKYEVLKNSIAELEHKFSDVSFDEKEFEEQQLLVQLKKTSLDEATSDVTKSKAEINRLEREFEDKKELLLQVEGLQKRAENLKTLFNLFKGAGFVQYVSSIYLRQLCDHANIRFHRMTRNQLSLQLNENNDFEIIDYLNEGRSRSVKTLSGGQSFQVSLSLALALAESVQSNARADKNFFFIDEGFGTQDMESINIVFETLQSLLKENRIVGIISHVEELKERIPLSLQVTKDEEFGSMIVFN